MSNGHLTLSAPPGGGGVFERMVKSVKRCLRKVVAKASLSFEELLTVVTEVEMIINCHPLSFISQNDLEEPLTPSHLINGRRLMDLPDGMMSEEEDAEDQEFNASKAILTRRMKVLNCLMDHFWKRWKYEYLLELRNHHRSKMRKKGRQIIAEGDVVILHDDQERRRFWKLGLVVETIPGKNGEVRGAVVKVCPKGGKCKLMRRSVQHLYPLEVSSSGPLNEDPPESPRIEDGEGMNTEDGIDKEPCSNLGESPRRHSPEVSVDKDQTSSCVDDVSTNRTSSFNRVDRRTDDANQGLSIHRQPQRQAAQLARDKIMAQELL